MSPYRAIKLFLTAVEQEQTQADLRRALRRRAFTPAQARAKDERMGRLMMRCDLLTEEIQALQGRGA